MVKILRNENKVLIRVESGVFQDGAYFEFDITQSHNYQAELLRRQFEKHLNDNLARLKREYYEAGWKEAKSHKHTKRTNFYGGWEQ